MESSINKSGKINYEFCECVEKYEDGLARFGLAPYQTFKIPIKNKAEDQESVEIYKLCLWLTLIVRGF